MALTPPPASRAEPLSSPSLLSPARRLNHTQRFHEERSPISPSPRRGRGRAGASVLEESSVVSAAMPPSRLLTGILRDGRASPGVLEERGKVAEDREETLPAARAKAQIAAETLGGIIGAAVQRVHDVMEPIGIQVSCFVEEHLRSRADSTDTVAITPQFSAPGAAAAAAASTSLRAPLLAVVDGSDESVRLKSHCLLQNWISDFFDRVCEDFRTLTLHSGDLQRAFKALGLVSDTILISDTTEERASKASRFVLRDVVFRRLKDSPLAPEDQNLLLDLIYCDPNFFELLQENLENAGETTWPSYHHYKRYLQSILNNNPAIGIALESLTSQLLGEEWAAKTDFTHFPLFKPLPAEVCMLDDRGEPLVTVRDYKERRLQFPWPLYESFAETLFKACRFERFDSSSKMLDHMLDALREWLANCSEDRLPKDTTDNAHILLALLHQFQGEPEAKETISSHMTTFLEADDRRLLTHRHVHIHDAKQALPTVLAALETRLRSQVSSPLTYIQHNRLWTANKLFQLVVLAFAIYELVSILQGKNTAFSDISLPILLAAAVLCSDLFDSWAHNTEVHRFMSAMNALLHERESTVGAFCARNADTIKLVVALLTVTGLITTAIVADAKFDDPSIPTPTADEWGVTALMTQPLAGGAAGLTLSSLFPILAKCFGNEQPTQVTSSSEGTDGSARPATSRVVGGFGVGTEMTAMSTGSGLTHTAPTHDELWSSEPGV